MFLCNFKEYGPESNVSMSEFFEKKPYEGQDKIVSYLRNKGRATVASTDVEHDRITHERIKGAPVFYTDGKYSWCSDLAYHVEKYNLRLPKEFEDFVLGQQ